MGEKWPNISRERPKKLCHPTQAWGVCVLDLASLQKYGDRVSYKTMGKYLCEATTVRMLVLGKELCELS